ncbi:MAG TPA: hypothetical protein VFX86_02800 [Candidatus Saccharimonadales bacterium]|nr:hypothetical protein [Candidatus Saccharimonadales bacterium]
MFRRILMHIRHPYVVGIVTVVWVGTWAFYDIDNQLPVTAMVIIDSLLTLAITRHAMNS